MISLARNIFGGWDISHFDYPISRPSDIVQKSFCTPDGAMDPPFQMNYVQAFLYVCSLRNESKTMAQI